MRRRGSEPLTPPPPGSAERAALAIGSARVSGLGVLAAGFNLRTARARYGRFTNRPTPPNPSPQRHQPASAPSAVLWLWHHEDRPRRIRAVHEPPLRRRTRPLSVISPFSVISGSAALAPGRSPTSDTGGSRTTPTPPNPSPQRHQPASASSAVLRLWHHEDRPRRIRAVREPPLRRRTRPLSVISPFSVISDSAIRQRKTDRPQGRSVCVFSADRATPARRRRFPGASSASSRRACSFLRGDALPRPAGSGCSAIDA
jgi:hypothetical protein